MSGFSLTRLFTKKQPTPSHNRQDPLPPRHPTTPHKTPVSWLKRLRRTEPPTLSPNTTSHFMPYQPPPGIVPEGYNRPTPLGSDAAPSTTADITSWAMGQTTSQPSWMADGLGFLGYPTLAQMAQRAEFRKPCDVIAREATREWISLSTHNPADCPPPGIPQDPTTRLHALEVEMKRLNIRELLHQQILDSLLYGIGHIWLNMADTPRTTYGQTLPLPLTSNGVRKGTLAGLKTIEPIWTTPNAYNADSPLQDDYYRPRNWWVQGCLVHRDRLISMIPYGVSDLFKPSFNFGGMSLTQQLRPYVHNFLRTRNSISNITANFSKLVLKTDMGGLMATGTSDEADPTTSITGRASFMQKISEGQDIIVADHQNEDISIIATPLTGLADLQAQAMEAMASIPGIPLVKLFGITPNGLNASSAGEIRVFYDEIAAFQEAHMRPVLTRLLTLLQLNLWGATDPALEITFNPLWQHLSATPEPTSSKESP
ncbi:MULTISPECIES: phage portal protein [Bombella]|uniref:DUF1073 domain-containing protein n=1 Tax=Bombella pollinis TaxID=2967337 RepID=A0ABT3WK55_9PROT|nr:MULTISPECIES: DUF1073 domain-containing protein [Bombella]MCX5619479.1 DUF1073 domain-containing protein [Bombella pollinis]MUG89682.1 DUF1073 domain-containing protein [Bombella sp. ESL0385]PHI97567.1 hypothetical protein BG621_02125 [Parasaccharibacter apium]